MSFMRSVLRAAGVAAFFLVLVQATSCSPRIIETIKTETVIEQKDSIAWRDTTIYVPIPLGSSEAITAVGDTAKAKTAIAEAASWVDGAGKLHLELNNRKGFIPHDAKIPSRTIWTSVNNTRAETLTRTVEVEKPLSWWQKFRIGAFWWLILLAAIGFRKEILALIKKIVKFATWHNHTTT